MSSTTLSIASSEEPVITSTTEKSPPTEIKIIFGSDESNKSADQPKGEVPLMKIEDTAEKEEVTTVENLVTTQEAVLESKLIFKFRYYKLSQILFWLTFIIFTY